MTTEVKLYSLEEVSKNNGKDTDRTWIIIKDNVYDVTTYLDDHPGGGDLITEWAGKDGTKAFDEFGHSGDAKKDLKAFKIGELRDEDRKTKKKVEKNSPVVNESPVEKQNRSCISAIFCGLCG